MPVIKVKRYFSNEMIEVTIDEIPNECPLCHNKISPIYIDGYIIQISIKMLQAIYVCPFNNCKKIFIGYYNASGGEYYFKKSAPMNPIINKFSDEIKNISSMFITIYNQTGAAESFNLVQITGMGYRKALEFLIKDYAIIINPDKKEEIKKTWLGEVINKYIDDERIKNVAQRATWLGNDESHYIRKWEDKDINDLKELIRLTINFIENEIIYRKYKEEMPGKKKYNQRAKRK